MMLSKTFVVGVDLAIGIALVMCLSVSQPAQAHQQRINATSLASKSLSAGVLGQVKARPFLHRMATLTASRNDTAPATATLPEAPWEYQTCSYFDTMKECKRIYHCTCWCGEYGDCWQPHAEMRTNKCVEGEKNGTCFYSIVDKECMCRI